MATFYTVLGLPETATNEQIKQAYRMLAKRYHPDLHPGDASFAKKFAEVNEAMETLGDPQKRKEYDEQRVAAKRQADAQAAAQRAAAQARAQAARAGAAGARAGMGGMGGMGGASRPYAGTAQGAAQVVNDAYRKGYNEGFAAAQQQRNAAAETWKKSADNWQKEAEKCRSEVDVLKAALEKTRQRAADAEASARRMEASLRIQRNATEEARRATEAEILSKQDMCKAYDAKIAAEREARKISDADKVRLSREITRLKEENLQYRNRLGTPPPTTPPADEPHTFSQTNYEQAASGTKSESTYAKYEPTYETAQAASEPAFETAATSEPAYNTVQGDSVATPPPAQEPPAVADLRERAESGDGIAAVQLGKLLLDGNGGAHKDANEAVRYFTMGMTFGNLDALYYLGLCCLNGEGTECDFERGMQLMHEAAEQGNELATQIIRESEK